MSEEFQDFFSDSLSKLGLTKSVQMFVENGVISFRFPEDSDYRSIDEVIDDVNVVIERRLAIKKLTELGYDASFLENFPAWGRIPPAKDKIQMMMEAGFSPVQASKILGVSLSAYYRACRRNGIHPQSYKKKQSPLSSRIDAGPFENLPDSKNFQIKKIRQQTSDEDIKNFLLNEKILQEECFFCGFRERNAFSNEVPLFLDYIDGDRENLTLKNLRLLCPNHFYLYGYLHRKKETR